MPFALKVNITIAPLSETAGVAAGVEEGAAAAGVAGVEDGATVAAAGVAAAGVAGVEDGATVAAAGVPVAVAGVCEKTELQIETRKTVRYM